MTVPYEDAGDLPNGGLDEETAGREATPTCGHGQTGPHSACAGPALPPAGPGTPEQQRARESLRRQYEVAVRRNRCIPEAFSLAPRKTPPARETP